MVKYILIFSSFYFLNFCYAQNINLDYKNAVKVYNLTTIEQFEKSTDTTYTESITTFQILNLTIAFQWKTKKNNFHEVELTTFSLNKSAGTLSKGYYTNGSPPDEEISTTSISARYEYAFNFNKSKDHKLVPSLGLGIGLYYKRNSYSPAISSSYSSSETFTGARTFITPRLTYYLLPRFFIDLNIPVCFSDAYYFIQKENDPTIVESERTSTILKYDQFPKIFSGRIGIGFKL